MAYRLFYESIKAQSRALSRIPLVCSFLSFGFHPSCLSRSKQEVMSVYQSEMLGDDDDDERDTGFRQVLDILFRQCVFPTSLGKKTVSLE